MKAGEVAELGDGRSHDRVNRRVIERQMAAYGAAAIDPEVCPGPGPHLGIADIVRQAYLHCAHVELPGYVRGDVVNDDASYSFIVALTEHLQFAACLVWRLLRASFRPVARQCRRRTTPTNGASGRLVRTRHDAARSHAKARSASRRPNC